MILKNIVDLLFLLCYWSDRIESEPTVADWQVLTEANAKTSQQKKESNRVVMSLSDDTECYNNKEGKKAGTRTSTAYVPPYCIWVEGDNPTNSRDSRSKDHGPVTKKLLVGIAEYRVWPPWRMGKLDNKKQTQ